MLPAAQPVMTAASIATTATRYASYFTDMMLTIPGTTTQQAFTSAST